jgi:hypothetical protein
LWKKLVLGNQNDGLVQDGVIFGKNRLFFERVSPLKNIFFQSVKASLYCSDPRHAKKKLPRKKIQAGGDFQDGVCTFWKENMFCERSIRYIKLIFGVFHYCYC